MELPAKPLSAWSQPLPPDSAARRAWLQRVAVRAGCALVPAAVLVAAVVPRSARAHGLLGPLAPPLPAPPLPLVLHDGRRSSLPELLRGRITALQLMFTGCSATCPLQGAAFAELQRLLRPASLSRAQLLSVSIDPLGDDPTALAAWRQRFGADGRWLAAAPLLRHAEVLPDFLGGKPRGGRGNDAGDRHSTQVFLFDPQARLAFRTAELAAPQVVAELLAQLAARS